MRSTYKIFITSILFIITGWGCSSESRSHQEFDKLDLSFEEEFVLPDPARAKDSVIFSFPARIRTDDSENIYVSDRDIKTIRVFDGNGNLINSIGRSGRGPGEFTDPVAMAITLQNELIVWDEDEQRLSRFSSSGEFLTNILQSQEFRIRPEKIRQVDSGQFLFLDMIGSGQNEEGTPLEKSLMHIHDSTLKNRISSFGHIDTVLESRSDFARKFTSSFGLGNIATDENGTVWHVPTLYEGRIFKYQNTATGWKLTDTIQGHLMAEESHEAGYKGENASVIISYTPEGRSSVSALLKSESVGLFVLNDKRLVHFSAQLVDTTRTIITEIFNPQGSLQGIGELERFKQDKSSRNADISFVWKDDQDRFYIFDDRGAARTIRVGEIEGL